MATAVVDRRRLSMAPRDDGAPAGAAGGCADVPCITIFRTRLRPEYAREYAPLEDRIQQLAEQAPGFVRIETYAADDGERVSVVEFASRAASLAWRNREEHREAQRLGRERYFAAYRIQVCECFRDEAFPAGSPDAAMAPSTNA